MAISKPYMLGRIKWARPQAMLWSDNYGTLSDGWFLPIGTENEDFIITSDHNRKEINMSQQRIENRRRMVNGTMRSYHTADKLTLSTSWENLPSRSFSTDVSWDSNGNLIQSVGGTSEYTVDGGAGGVQILDWYESHPGPFYCFLSYDEYSNFNSDKYDHLNQYSKVLHVYFSSFEYTISKRGATNHDLWNIDITLEEV